MKTKITWLVTTLFLSACVTPLEPVRPTPDDTASKTEAYVECLRRKDKEADDGPCFLD